MYEQVPVRSGVLPGQRSPNARKGRALATHPLRPPKRSRPSVLRLGCRWAACGLVALATTACSVSDQSEALAGGWSATAVSSLASAADGATSFELRFEVRRRWWGSSDLQTDCGTDGADWHTIDAIERHKAPRGVAAGEFGVNCSTYSGGLVYINALFVGSAMVGKILTGHIDSYGLGSTRTFYDETDDTFLFVAEKAPSAAAPDAG